MPEEHRTDTAPRFLRWSRVGRLRGTLKLAVWTLFLGLALGACSGGDATKGAHPRKQKKTSGELMTCLAMIRAHHRQADLYLKMGDTSKALTAVERIFTVPCPRTAPEAASALLDAHARLAKLHLKRGEVGEALKTVREGLKRYTHDSFFRAHLLMVHADVLDVQAKRLSTAGKKKEADKLRRLAIESLSRSIKINRRLQRDLLEE